MAALVKNELHKDLGTGTVFVFRSRRADRLKLLYWVSLCHAIVPKDNGARPGWSLSAMQASPAGQWMADKRLEENTFTSPAIKCGVMNLCHAQFEALFSGLDWRRVRAVEVRAQMAVKQLRQDDPRR